MFGAPEAQDTSRGDDLVDESKRLTARLPEELAEVREMLVRLGNELEAAHQRVVLFGLDLHDSALQDIVALGTDAHLFKEQLARALEGHPDAGRLLGRIDDLLARLSIVDVNLRNLALAAESSGLLQRPLVETLRETVEGFDGEDCRVSVTGAEHLDDGDLSESQRIAVVRFVQSALSNIAQHSRATQASVDVRRIGDTVEVDVVDNGTGFDVDSTMRRAAEAGRLGLVGMRERIRALGGELSLESRPGGPTRIRARFGVGSQADT